MNRRNRLPPVLIALAALSLAGVALNAFARRDVTPVPVANGDFAAGLNGWIVGPDDGGRATLTPNPAPAEGGTAQNVLKITDNDADGGSDISTARIPLSGVHLLTVHVRAFVVNGSGLGIYLRCYAADGHMIGEPAAHEREAPVTPLNQWQPFTLTATTPPDTASVDIWVHSYKSAKVTAYLTDFNISDKGGDVTKPPWTPQYKIKPDDTARLTEADIVGPDGIVYPDWRGAGMPGGIPKVAVRARAADFGAIPNDDKDDSEAIEKGLAAVGEKGGGALLLAPGTYDLDRPIVSEHDGVVLRGAGEGKTTIRFRYGGADPGQVQFYRPLPGSVVDPSSWIEIHADPADLRQLALEVDGKQVATTTYYPQHWGGTFSLRPNAANIVGKLADGPHVFRAVAVYESGKRVTHDMTFKTSRTETGRIAHTPHEIGAIMFNGPSATGPKLLLARDGKRGQRTVILASPPPGIHAGDWIVVSAPATPRWNTLVNNACKWGDYRRCEYIVRAINGATVTLNQPLRIDFPIIDGAFVSRVERLEHCGVEDLTLVQTKELWTSGVLFSNASECWARNVDVQKAGRYPLYFLYGKWNEIDDCSMEDVWYHGGGGTGYVGWEYSYDCLMQRVHTVDMRHAPLFQWSANGNVIRNSTFINSDAQWHSGWTNENLFENCVIQSARGDRNGGYGYGMWGSAPEDDAHGPNGPRNVVYNCDDTSQKQGVLMGGMNEGWIFVGNRYVVGSGEGVLARETSFDHILQNNVFVLRDSKASLLVTGTPDCTGIELRGNTIYGGSGELSGGAAKALVTTGNELKPGLTESAPLPARPKLAVPSIFEWERESKVAKNNVSKQKHHQPVNLATRQVIDKSKN